MTSAAKRTLVNFLSSPADFIVHLQLPFFFFFFCVMALWHRSIAGEINRGGGDCKFAILACLLPISWSIVSPLVWQAGMTMDRGEGPE